jgi:hypothetical protein
MDVRSYKEHQQVLNRQQVDNQGLAFPNRPESHRRYACNAHNWIEQDHIPDQQQTEESVLLQSEARPLSSKIRSVVSSVFRRQEGNFIFIHLYIPFNLRK